MLNIQFWLKAVLYLLYKIVAHGSLLFIKVASFEQACFKQLELMGNNQYNATSKIL